MSMISPAVLARRKLITDTFPPERIAGGTRGLTMGGYAQAFNAGANIGSSEVARQRQVNAYMSRAGRTDAEVAAFLDGSTNYDDYPETILYARIAHPEAFA